MNRLSAIQNDQLIQPRAFILVKHSVGNGFRSIIPPKQSKPPETQQVTPPVVERREIKVSVAFSPKCYPVIFFMLSQLHMPDFTEVLSFF